jgi:anti-sigma regulatory factor (Ser/Thr protein kinase)
MTTRPTPDGRHPPALDGGGVDIVLLDQPFTERDLTALRRTVAAHADRVGLPAGRIADLILIVSELASNAVRHGGGKGRLRLWTTSDGVHCQIIDDGPGLPESHQLPRRPPEPNVTGGRGLWLVLTFADNLSVDIGNGGGTVATATLQLPAPISGTPDDR